MILLSLVLSHLPAVPAATRQMLLGGLGTAGAPVSWALTDSVDVLGALDLDAVGLLNQPHIDLDPFTTSIVAVPPESAELRSRLGVNIHFTRDAAALDVAHAIGFSWVRMDLAWVDIETAPGIYDFSAYDQLLHDLEQRDLRVLFILDYGHPLYTGGERFPPTTPAALEAFGRFAEAAARHFAGRHVTYEIWNEPNLRFFWPPQPNADQYTALLNETIARVRAGDPQAQIVTGGLSGGDFAFLRDMLQAGVSPATTAIGFHPYRFTVPETLTAELLEWRSIVSATTSNSLPTWDTEWGYSATWFGYGHSIKARTRQAVMVARELLTAWSAGFPLIIYYDLRDDGPNPLNAEHNFGLMDRANAAKPALQAVRTLTTAAQQRRLTGRLSSELPQLHALRLDGATDRVVVVWTSSGHVTVRVPAPLTAVDMLGEPLTLYPAGDQSELVISEAAGPVYLTYPQ